MRVMIPRAVLSSSAAGSSRRNKWWWRRRHGEVGRKRVRDSSDVGVNRRWWVFNGSPGEPWSLSVTPFQKHITTTWTSARAHAVTALCCCLNRIKMGHVGLVLLLYIYIYDQKMIIWIWNLCFQNHLTKKMHKMLLLLLLLLFQLSICIIIIIIILACDTHHVPFSSISIPLRETFQRIKSKNLYKNNIIFT